MVWSMRLGRRTGVDNPLGVFDTERSVVTALDALHTARMAWERSQPQLIFDLWDDGVLEEVEATRAGWVPTAATSISSSASADGMEPSAGLPLLAEGCGALDIGAGHGGEPPGSIPGSSTPAEEAANPSRSDDRGAGYATTEPSASAGDSPPLHGPPAPTPSRRARTGRRR